MQYYNWVSSNGLAHSFACLYSHPDDRWVHNTTIAMVKVVVVVGCSSVNVQIIIMAQMCIT